MPKKVTLPKGKTFEFKKATGAGSKYNWDAMFTGDLVLISKGTDDQLKTGDCDYTVAEDAMIPKIKTAARRRYKVVSVSRVDHQGNKLVDSLILQARDMTADERTAEDQKRAEEKIARAEARAEEEGESTEGETAAA